MQVLDAIALSSLSGEGETPVLLNGADLGMFSEKQKEMLTFGGCGCHQQSPS